MAPIIVGPNENTHSALTVEQFAEYLERSPPTMLCWQRPGRGGAPTVLVGLNYRAALLDTETPLQAADQHNALAVAARLGPPVYQPRRPAKRWGALTKKYCGERLPPTGISATI